MPYFRIKKEEIFLRNLLYYKELHDVCGGGGGNSVCIRQGQIWLNMNHTFPHYVKDNTKTIA
ncbi:hypothetical protein AGMMS49991_00670 [Spirochaetia bacterium]|nr:hypothetical protein AGMMS49991_00670 [Spirochaetia bacterium]